jgi:hypothetical protein
MKVGRTVCVYSMVQWREKEKNSRYIQEASAPAATPCIRPVTCLRHKYTCNSFLTPLGRVISGDWPGWLNICFIWRAIIIVKVEHRRWSFSSWWRHLRHNDRLVLDHCRWWRWSGGGVELLSAGEAWFYLRGPQGHIYMVRARTYSSKCRDGWAPSARIRSISVSQYQSQPR